MYLLVRNLYGTDAEACGLHETEQGAEQQILEEIGGEMDGETGSREALVMKVVYKRAQWAIVPVEGSFGPLSTPLARSRAGFTLGFKAQRNGETRGRARSSDWRRGWDAAEEWPDLYTEDDNHPEERPEFDDGAADISAAKPTGPAELRAWGMGREAKVSGWSRKFVQVLAAAWCRGYDQEEGIGQ